MWEKKAEGEGDAEPQPEVPLTNQGTPVPGSQLDHRPRLQFRLRACEVTGDLQRVKDRKWPSHLPQGAQGSTCSTDGYRGVLCICQLGQGFIFFF